MHNSTTSFDLSRFKTSPESKIFSGRPRGEWCRGQMRLDELDRQGADVTIIVPEDTYSLNMSFFLGAFGESVRFFGKSAFETHYHFEGPVRVLKLIPKYVEEALQDSISLPEKKTA